MKLREKSNIEICDENNLPFSLLTNVVEEANTKNKIRSTMNIFAKALIGTLGPYGTTTVIQDREMRHFATKDGYDLMNRISFEDEVSRTILDLVRNITSNQALTVGDGTTSAVVIANALYQSLTDNNVFSELKLLAPKDILDILNAVGEKVEKGLKSTAIPVSAGMKELDKIAAVAINNDKEAGELVAEIYRKIGKYGFISTDVLTKKEKDCYEIKQGIEWNRGYIDPVYGMNSESKKVVYENPRIILCNETLTYEDLQPVIMPLMQTALNQENAQLLVVVNNYDDDVARFFKNNRTKHRDITKKTTEMDFTVVDIEQVTKTGINNLKDLALLCNCEIYDKMTITQAEVVMKPQRFIGTAGKVIVTEKTTQIIAAEEKSADHTKSIDSVIKDLTEKLEKLLDKDEITKEDDMNIYELRRRISNLTSSTAIFYVGGKTLSERMTRERLIEDAIFACKSTLKYGYIPGGNLSIPRYFKKYKTSLALELADEFEYIPVADRQVFFENFIDLLMDTFLESYRNVLNNSYLSEERVEEYINTCLTEDKFYNLKLHRFEEWALTSVINSVDTDIQIMRSCFSIIGILATSNQFLTLNFDVSGNIRK